MNISKAREALARARYGFGATLLKLRNIKENPDNYPPLERDMTIQELRYFNRMIKRMIEEYPELTPIKCRQLSFKRQLCMSS